MLEILNRYSHGLAYIPMFHALRERGCLVRMAETPSVSAEQLAQAFSANRGYLDVALRMLVCLDWIRPAADGRYEARPGLASLSVIPDRIMDLYNFPFDLYVRGEAGESLEPWLENSERRWNSKHPYLPDYLDGLLIIPLLLSLRAQGQLGIAEQDSRTSVARLNLNVDPLVRRSVERLFIAKGWGTRADGALQLNQAGRFIVNRIFITATVASYRPMFGRAQELLFGDPARVFARDPQGHETHVDRTVNVIGSGFQHEKYFVALSDLVVRCFDNESFSSQPKYICDMGCGDGSLLRRLYETVRDRTRRGKVLDVHPVIPVAADFNEKALAEASRTLAGIQHIAIKGDIGNPAALLEMLRASGVEDVDRVLHVRSFLDHNRPYLPPEDRKAAERRSQFSSAGMYIDSQGRLIPPGDMIQSTVEHLRRWSEIVNSHGLVMLEVHCLPPDVTARYLDESESFHFDAYHAMSHQYLLDAQAFLACAAEAALFCREAVGFPKNLPFTRISLSHFERRPYRVRCMHDQDLPAVAELDEVWAQPRPWSDAEQSVAALEPRPFDFSEQEFMLEAQGRVLASVRCNQKEQVQITSAYLRPAVPASYLRDLLQFVEQYWALAGVAHISGIEDCRYALSTRNDNISIASAVAHDLMAFAARHPFAAADDPRAAERELGIFSFRWLLAILQRMGVMRHAGETYDLGELERRIGVSPKYHRYFEALMRRLQDEGLVKLGGHGLETTALVPNYPLSFIEEQVAEFKQEFQRRYPGTVALMNLTVCCLARFEEIITGRIDITDVLFQNASMDVFADIFRGHAASDFFNQIIADAVHDTVLRLKPIVPKIRILEIGAGTGSTTAAVLEALKSSFGFVDFWFTDISLAFIRNARRRFSERYPSIEYRLLNIEEDLSEQGFAAHSFDIIVAANVLHDTRDVEFALKQVRRLLKSGGLLVLDEYTSIKDCLFFSGALLHGYWLFEDPERRLRDSCLLGVSQWMRALEQTGFAVAGLHALPTQNLDSSCSQSVMICEALRADQLEEERTGAAEAAGQNVNAGKTAIVGAFVEQQVVALLGEKRAPVYSAQRPFMDMGLDSIEMVELKFLLERHFGIKLSPMFLFQYETPEKMTAALSGMVPDEQFHSALPIQPGEVTSGGNQAAADETTKVLVDEGERPDAIAIVGVACRFPGGSASPKSFWKLLDSGRHGIVSMPDRRWKWPRFINPQGEHKGIDKAGFLDRIDEFDAPFFRTSPKEAKLMDPQQRLLLELSWEAMEDGGHRPSELRGRKIGVFVGVCHGDYRELLTTASESESEAAYVGTGSAYSLLANRLSYFYDFKGPSLIVDTACSSSLFALHDAVTAIRQGDCEQALVGAANLLCGPTNSIAYYRAGMLSPTGRCRTFDETADGYVRGEGAAVLLLKPLAMALVDGDSIYGLIRGTAVNHGGQAASLTAPKPEAQASVIEAAWRAANVAVESVGYIETHGTGTKLGDPVEIGGLTEAFRRLYEARGNDAPVKPHCGLGSVKTNIGHLEGAAGLAGVIKILMAMRHGSIPPTLNFEQLNSHISLADTPFYIVARKQAWSCPRDQRGQELPRRAGVSSFGFGGANAHAVIEEYPRSGQDLEPHPGRCVVPLSARDNMRLLEQARRLQEFLASGIGSGPFAEASLVPLAYTLQVGREPMQERVAFLVQSTEELLAALQAFVAGSTTIPNSYRSHAELQGLIAGTSAKEYERGDIETAIAGRDLTKLASLWVKGLEVDWSKLYDEVKPRRISLPTYPFARERYWIEIDVDKGATAEVLHPLLHRNTSDLKEQRYTSTFTGEEFFFTDHQVRKDSARTQKLLPAVACLEMARVAIEEGCPKKSQGTVLELCHTVWGPPIVVQETEKKEVSVALWAKGEKEIEYEIYSEAAKQEIVHCQGCGVWSDEALPARLDVEQLLRRTQGGVEPEQVYEAWARQGLHYGTGMQSIRVLRRGEGQVLVQLQLPEDVGKTFGDYALHPSLMDGTLQACIGLLEGVGAGEREARVPFALERLRIVTPCSREMWVWVRYAQGSGAEDEVTKLDVDLCDKQGNISAQMRGLSWHLASPEVAEPILNIEASTAVPVAPLGPSETVPAATRREIAFLSEDQSALVPVQRKKPGCISLESPTFLNSAASAENTSQASAGQALIKLSNATLELTALSGAEPVSPSVRLYDHGQGVFSISQEALSNCRTPAKDRMIQFLQALDKVKQEPTIKVLKVTGLEHCFQSGGREEYNQAVGQGLYQTIVSFPYPVIAVLQNNVIGAGFLAAALCDFMVCNKDATYAYTDIQARIYPTTPEAILLSERFGAGRAQDLLYISSTCTGRQLRRKGWTCPVVSATQVETCAEQLASSLALKSREALHLLKQHLSRQLVRLVKDLPLVEVAASSAEDCSHSAGKEIVSATEHIQLETPAEHVLVARFCVANQKLGIKDLVAELRAILTQAAQLPYYKAVVLAGEELDFLGGVEHSTAEDVVQGVQHLLGQKEIPVVAALAGNAKGLGWMISQLCDACVYSETGIYSAAGIGQDATVRQMAAGLFMHRMGSDAGKEILLTGVEYSGVDLYRRVSSLMLAEPGQVLPAALQVAGFWARLPRTTLVAWTKHTSATIQQKLDNLQTAVNREEQDEALGLLHVSPKSIPLRSRVVTAMAHPEGVVVVKMEDREAKNMFSDAFVQGVKEAFAHIEEVPVYKVVVLTGYDTYFSSGGTKENLLAIQEGKVKFTDIEILQVALDCKLPVIAAMQGHGIGAGWTLGMFADLVLFSEESRYVSPYMSYGFTPGAGATWILGDKMGQDLARESLLTGQQYSGKELKDRGLRLRILPRADIHAAALALARQIARNSRRHLMDLKQQLNEDLRKQLRETYQLELAMHEKTFIGQSGTLEKIQKNFYQEIEASSAVQQVEVEPTAPSVDAGFLLTIAADIKTLLANELQMREGDISENVQFVEMGLDSISAVTWVRKISEKYHIRIEATKVYIYPTLEQFSRYVKDQASRQGTLPSVSAPPAIEIPLRSNKDRSPQVKSPEPVLEKLTSRRSRTAARFVSTSTSAARSQSIAVIGMAGQFPQANNLEEFWQNLAQGRNCITQVPCERWDVNAYYRAGSIVAGKTNSQWSGGLEEYDRFDPLFFNISPTEAENMEPQQRLFLQACWHTIEDAAYDARALSGSKCGVFVGCANGDYHLLSREHQLSAQGFTGSEASILAARISYFLNLQGPCLSIDTACSSSLVALAHACDSLVSFSSDLALAGGVYVMTGPEMHIKTAQAGMLSAEGRCYSFDQRANGFVPGEGVGVVLLKRLVDAERDGDHIYGVIAGWGVNQDGKSNGITAPNPESQARLEQEVYEKYQIDPGQIQLVEAHGTGTKLGDPIEVEGLKKAFGKYTQKQEYCALGSVKSNIGHALWAAGIAGVIKVMLALKHRQLPPTINFEGLNEHIELKGSPFYVSSRLQEWEVGGGEGEERRQGAVSSFGFSGTNAHVVIGEYVAKETNKGPVRVAGPATKVMVPLSARTVEQLRQKARDLLGFIRKEGSRGIELNELAYTLQVGREGMEERLGLLVESLEELEEKLAAYVEGKGESRDIYQGEVGRNKESMSVISQDDEIKETLVDKWIAARKFAKLLNLWVKGLELNWNKLYGEAKPRRINLPVYPFAKERYWIQHASTSSAASLRVSSDVGAAVLHPLLHCNTSDLSEQRYSSTFAGDEFFFAEHLVRDARGVHKILPGVAFLEMTRAAIEKALPMRPEGAVLELRNTLWVQPLIFAGNEKKHMTIILCPNDEEEIDYEIHSRDGEQELIHCQGRAVWSHEKTPARLDVEQLTKEMREGDIDAAQVYTALVGIGILHGPSFQAITAVHHGTHQLLSRLRLPGPVESTSADYVLHPSLLDGALQGHVGLINGWSGNSSQTRLPFALESLRIISPCTREMVAWVRQAPGSRMTDNVVKFDVSLSDEHGNICVEIRGFSSRLVGQDLSIAATHAHLPGSLVAAPVWQASGVEASVGAEYGEHHLIICELPQVDVEQLGAMQKRSHCLLLQRTPEEKNIAQRYSEYAVVCLERIQKILQSKPQGKALVQVVVAEEGENALLAGLSGLLKTAGLEHPQLIGQVILVPAETTTEELGRHLQAEKNSAADSLVRYEAGVRKVLRWEEVKQERRTEKLWRDQGVYLITGGLGRLGLMFAKEILEQTSAARAILTGRSALTPEKQSQLDRLSAQAGRVSYRQLDLSDVDQVRQLISAIQKEYGQLNGILHSAGMIRDNFLLKKGRDEFSQVLGPKVLGTYNLDEASRGVELDFFVLFSSVAAVLGNIGQVDYVAANGFMDQFAAYRNRQVAMGERYGRTRSINWGLWESGGMSVDAATQELVEQRTGIRPMQSATGIKAFYHSMACANDQVLVAEGDRVQIGRALLAGPQATEPQPQVRVTTGIYTESLTEKTQDYLRRQFSGLLKVPSHKIDPHVALEKYGIDSILAMQLTNELEKNFGSLSKTLFFEYQTIRGLTEYFVAHFEPQLLALFAFAERRNEVISRAAGPSSPVPSKRNNGRRFSPVRKAPVAVTEPASPTESEPIAIIGLSGRYPKAANLDAYWRNLREGKDCITEVPKDRWDWSEYYSKERGQSGHLYCKWGGFIAGIDEFDPLFFNISPLEAEVIDPQERLFLQHAWTAVEDAGYTRAGLQVPHAQDLPGQVGVYAGVWYSEYQLLGVEASVRGRRMGIAGSVASIANRVSYALNLHGPSITVDTMCSSSLTAIHLACQDLKQGRISLALAGGVNLNIHPSKYLMLSAVQALSGEGHCQSFGERGDGYVPADGVGVVILKRLSEAQRDGDHIYGIIRGTALNHGGKTNGYTVPNPQAQASAISRALREAGVDARHISYIEAHGTGTKLGDPIEIAGLSKAFGEYTQETGFCRIGSAKSNIGHCESAAGIAGLTKVLLQMEHEEIVPSLHAQELNPHIDFGKSPFMVNRELRRWERPEINGTRVPRIAGISSFGAGGSNAHMIVEEYDAPAPATAASIPAAIVLSARTPAQLKQKVVDLIEFIRARHNNINLASLSYTLQVGREGMEERLGLEAGSVEQLLEKLEAYARGEKEIEGVYEGEVKRNQETLALFRSDPDLQQTVEGWLAMGKLAKVLDLWVKGWELDWTKLYGEMKPQRMSLPTYPFARERYWIPDITTTIETKADVGRAGSGDAIHPMVHRNTSDFTEQRFTSTFSGEEFFLSDHVVNGERVLPGVAYLEMVRAGVEAAASRKKHAGAPVGLRLKDVIWVQPIRATGEPVELHIGLRPAENGEIDYEIYREPANETARSEEGDHGRVIHSQGRALLVASRNQAHIDIAKLQGVCKQRVFTGAECYEAFKAVGLDYGPAYRGIEAIYSGVNGAPGPQVLAKLKMPICVAEGQSGYVLHPSMMDAALQASLALMLAGKNGVHGQMLQPCLPFSLEQIEITAPCPEKGWAWLRWSEGSNSEKEKQKFDIDLCDEQGKVCVGLRGLTARALKKEGEQELPVGNLMFAPVWDVTVVEQSSLSPARTEKLLIVGGTEVHHELIRKRYPEAQTLTLGSGDEIEVIAQQLKARDPFDHLLWIVPDSAATSVADEAFIEGQEKGVLFCFRLIKALLQSGYGSRTLGWTVITTATQAIHQHDASQPVHASVHGLIGSMAKEYNNWKIRLVDVEANSEWPFDQILMLDPDPQGDAWVYRKAGWYRPKLVRCELPLLTDGLYRTGGVYVVIGGARGVGEVFSEHLIRKYQAQIIWIGRRGKDEQITEKQERLSRLGPMPEYIQADAGSYKQLQRAYEQIRQSHGVVHGVVHSALLLLDKSLWQMDEERFKRALAGKVDTSVRMAQVFSKEKLDFVIFFSSLQSFSKAAGQSNYAAGCTFVDAYSHELRRQWKCPVKVINWGYWGRVGVVATREYQERMAQAGLGSIEPEEGMLGLEQLLCSPLAQAAFVKATHTDAVAKVQMQKPLQIAVREVPSVLEKLKAAKPVEVPQELVNERRRAEALEKLLGKLLFGQMNSLGAFAGQTIEQWRQKIGVPELYQGWVDQSIRTLEELGFVGRAGEGWKVNGSVAVEMQTASREWERYKEEAQEGALKVQVRLLDATLCSLSEVLCGQRLATEVLFPNSSMDLVEGIYKNNAVPDYFNEELAGIVAGYVEERVRQDRGVKLRLLEVGAGTGGSSAAIFRMLGGLEEHIEEYAYTDVSRAFLLHAGQKYAEKLRYLKCRLFDVEQPVRGQAIDVESYDLVVAGNVLHATRNIRQTLRNLKATLKRHGVLLLNELAANTLFLHLTFGLTEGWWRFEDAELRLPGCPALPEDRWRQVLEEEGFAPVLFPAYQAKMLGQQIIVAESDGVIRRCEMRSAANQGPAKSASLLESKPVAAQPKTVEHAKEVHARGTQKTQALSAQMIERHVRSMIRESIAEVLKIEESRVQDDHSFSDYGVDSIIAVKVVNRMSQQCGVTLPVTIVFDHNNVEQLTRYMTQEHHASLVAMLQAPTEIPAEKTDSPAEKKEAGEKAPPTVAPSSDRVFRRWRKEASAAPVIAAHSSNGIATMAEGIYHKVVVERPGDIDDVKSIEASVPSLREHEVRIAVRAFSLNFGDLLCVRGLYPNMPAFPFTPGFEVSGTVVSVGQGVNSVKVGDEVIALGGDQMGGQATVLTCSEQQVFPKPDALSFEEACSLPAVGITMIDAFRKAQLQPGEKILIQTAAGGTGLIAVQLAQHAGAEVYATAGAPHKLEYLRDLGVKHTINYREMDFEQEIKRITGGAGVDVVINTLSGDAIQKGLNCLSAGGRYIEIAMTALKSAKAVDLSVLSNNQTFYSIDISRLTRKNPVLIGEYHRELMALVEQGVVRPTINEVLEFPRIQDAYRRLENRDNVGKIVVTIPDAYRYCESGMKATAAEAAIVHNSRTLSKEPIAIIGISGRFGAANTVDELWEYLSQGKDLTEEVSRWPRSPEAARFCPRGSFVHGIDQFDPLFFKISGVEATYMDPQQRLFLEETWKALEDAGYAGGVLEGRQCGVYVGCASGDYTQLFQGKVPSQAYWGNAGSVIPARIAYYLDLQGPAVAIDTACSSSLVAIHLACQALWAGEVEMAIAGGVFLQCTPRFYISSGGAGMLSPTGRCYTFDERADGFVPGEGVGVIVLKRLHDALAQGDHIYGVVRGSGINQDGTTNGITAPSAASQERLERHVYESFRIHPEEIQMVEAHGTGTKLGDPVEYQALTRSFRKDTDKKNYCAIGSIKTNIGHTAMAAGIAGVIKVLLSLQHKQIPPSVNYERGNSHIDFAGSPFYVNTSLKDWMVEGESRRCAVASSFGFSGTNAHIVIEEAPNAVRRHRERPGYLIVLSGRTEEQLRQQVKQLVQHIERTPVEDCGDISYTLLVGRKHWNHRLTCIVRSSAELLSMLKKWLDKGDASQLSVFQVQENDRHEKTSLKDYGHRCIEECRNGIDPVSFLERLAAIGELFGHGYNLPFDRIFAGDTYRRISLPTYPFARERYWVQMKDKESASLSSHTTGGVAQLHPLLHENTSDLIEQSYCTLFHGQEFFLTDHLVQGAKVLPGVVYLEMARAAVEQAMPGRPEPGILELRNVVWLKPVVVTGPQEVNIVLCMNENDQIDFEIYTMESGQRVVHSQGEAVFSHHSNPTSLDIEQLTRQMEKGRLGPSNIYPVFADIGLSYGPAHQGINAIFQGEKQILAQLHLPAIVETNHHEYGLHPSLMDAALQTSIGLVADGNHLPGNISMPFALESLRIISTCTKEMIAWVRYSQNSNAKLDMDLCDDQGNICVEMRGFTSRVLETGLKLGHQKTANGFHPNGVSHNGFHKDSVAFDDDFYQQVITDIVNGDVSIDEAVKLG